MEKQGRYNVGTKKELNDLLQAYERGAMVDVHRVWTKSIGLTAQIYWEKMRNKFMKDYKIAVAGTGAGEIIGTTRRKPWFMRVFENCGKNISILNEAKGIWK